MAYAKKRHLSDGRGTAPTAQEGPKIWAACGRETSLWVDNLDGEPVTCDMCKLSPRYNLMVRAVVNA